MKLTTGILFLGMVAGTAWGQNLDVIENTRNTMKAVQQKKAMDSDAALASSQGTAANPALPADAQSKAAQPSGNPALQRQSTGAPCGAVATAAPPSSVLPMAQNAGRRAGMPLADRTGRGERSRRAGNKLAHRAC